MRRVGVKEHCAGNVKTRMNNSIYYDHKKPKFEVVGPVSEANV